MAGEVRIVGAFVTALGETGITPRSLERVTNDPESMRAIKACIDEQTARLRAADSERQAEKMRVGSMSVSKLQQVTGVMYPYNDFDRLVTILRTNKVSRIIQLVTVGPDRLHEFGLTNYEMQFIEESLQALAHRTM